MVSETQTDQAETWPLKVLKAKELVWTYLQKGADS